MSTRNTTNLGHAFRVSDCYVWAEINYLDSATDYREYLPQHATPKASIHSEFVLLDYSWHLRRGQACLFLMSLVLFLIIVCAFCYERV